MAQKMLDANLDIIQNSNLEISLLNGDLNIIQKLDDEPNDVGGLTAGELKAKFDEAGNTIKSYINGTLIPQVLGAGATEAQRAENESVRLAAEAARLSAENARASAETTRAAAETARGTSEAARQSAETARQTAEAARAAAENTRDGRYQSAEAVRGQQYQAAEAARDAQYGGAETARQSAENIRAQAEQARQTAETARAAAEAGRGTAETARAEAEAARNVWEAYSAASSYQPGNKVTFAGSSYLCKVACTGTAPTNSAYWQLIASRGIDGSGVLVPVAIPRGRLLGDVDGDGRISYADANLASQASAALTPLDEIAELCADVNKDGEVDSKDVLIIKNVVSGRTAAFTEDVLENWTYDETAGLFRVEIPSPFFSANRSAAVFVPGLWPPNVFTRAELTDGALVIYTKGLPAEDAAALALLDNGAGEAVLSVQRTPEEPPVETLTLYANDWIPGSSGTYYYQQVSSDFAVSCEKQVFSANPYPLKNRSAYFEAGIYIVDGSKGSVQFRAKSLPTTDITLQLITQDL